MEQYNMFQTTIQVTVGTRDNILPFSDWLMGKPPKIEGHEALAIYSPWYSLDILINPLIDSAKLLMGFNWILWGFDGFDGQIMG